jgi:hypothetical protein
LPPQFRRCGLQPFFVDVATPVSLKRLFQFPSRANAWKTQVMCQCHDRSSNIAQLQQAPIV